MDGSNRKLNISKIFVAYILVKIMLNCNASLNACVELYVKAFIIINHCYKGSVVIYEYMFNV